MPRRVSEAECSGYSGRRVLTHEGQRDHLVQGCWAKGQDGSLAIGLGAASPPAGHGLRTFLLEASGGLGCSVGGAAFKTGAQRVPHPISARQGGLWGRPGAVVPG